MTSTPTHTLATGQPLSVSYGQWGSLSTGVRVSPDFQFGIVLGQPNQGKTTFLASNPAALIINADCTPHPDPGVSLPAQVFPLVNAAGVPIGPNGLPLYLKWSHISSMAESLIAAARDNKPRPRVVILDSIIGAIRLLQEEEVEFFNSNFAKEPKDRINFFYEFIGNWAMSAWGRVYDKFIPWILSLRAAGYGVVLVAHLAETTNPANGISDVNSINMPDRLWRRLHPTADYCVVVTASIDTRVVEDKEKVTMKDGSVIEMVKARTIERPVRSLIMNQRNLSGIVKCKYNTVDKIELEAGSGWSDFCTAVLKKS
jgi:hypothetical protein